VVTRYFDLHCDTMTECAQRDIPLQKNQLHVNMQRVENWEHYVQCYAVWLPDDLRGEPAWQRFLNVADRLSKEVEINKSCLTQLRDPGDLDHLEREGRHGAILTVESGAALGGKLEHIEDFKRLGVRMCTLTWNGATEIGRGVMAPGTTGLTDFGRKAVKAMEQAGILIDLSHASPELFWDVAEIADRPLVASHSNAKEICGHPRNLTKEQFLAIKKSGGLVGLNFYKAFLNDQPEKASMEDVLRHGDYFLSLGGEDILAMGGDWDGADLPSDMPGLSAIPALYELFLLHYPETVVEKIFYGNAARAFRKENLL
jgi:membrane dipeptidase